MEILRFYLGLISVVPFGISDKILLTVNVSKCHRKFIRTVNSPCDAL